MRKRRPNRLEPPEFVLFVNDPCDYCAHLSPLSRSAKIREHAPYPGLPIILTLRPRSRKIVADSGPPALAVSNISTSKSVSKLPMKSTQEITREVQELGQWIPALREQVGHVVVGQKYLVDRLLARPARQRPHPARRRSRPRQDAHGQDDGGRDPNRLSALAIYARSFAGGLDRHVDLQPAHAASSRPSSARFFRT